MSQRFSEVAAQEIYERLDEIQGEAMNDGQLDQDIESDRFTFVRMVAEIIDRAHLSDRESDRKKYFEDQARRPG